LVQNTNGCYLRRRCAAYNHGKYRNGGIEMITTSFTKLVGCEVPIQMAAMGGLANPKLIAAVSEAGGFGMIAVGRAGAARLPGMFDRVAELTSQPVGVNFLLPFMEDRAVIGVAARRARLVEFFFAEPDAELVKMVHAEGALAAWQVGSTREALAAADAGCDLIIAQGVEAGGHVRGRIGLLPLLSEVLDEVEIPVLAAGGIGTGRAMAAALAAGSAGVRIGTRLIATEEAGAHPTYVAALLGAMADDTVYTEAFSVGWVGDGPHRVLRSALHAAEVNQSEFVGAVVRAGEEPIAVQRFESHTPTTATTGAIDAMSLWAGESVGAVTRIQPAAEIIRELAAAAERHLRTAASSLS